MSISSTSRSTQQLTKKLTFALMLSALGCLGAAGSAKATPVVHNFIEGADGTVQLVDLLSGSTGDILSTIVIASDGEADFDPFGYGADTSDGIVLDPNWSADTSPFAPDPHAFDTGFWTNKTSDGGFLDDYTWVLPASTPCGTENDPSCEPIAQWLFTGGDFFQTTTINFWEDASMTVLSDVITVADITLTFQSDVGSSSTPLPGALPLFATGLGAFGLFQLRRKKKAAALAA